MDTKNVVILGGGFGGVRAALHLARGLARERLLDRYTITLIDRNAFHVYTPLLYRIAVPPVHPGRSVEESRATRAFQDIFKKTPVSFVQGEVKELDLVQGDIHLVHGEEFKCDYLVLAPGSESNYFGISGLKENSLSLKSLDDAQAIRRTLTELFAKNATARVAVGGGGPSGIELAAEIKYNYPRADVSIIEAAPDLLMGFNTRIVAPTERRLKKLGVNILTNEAIANVTAAAAATKSGTTIPFDTLIWTGGVKAPAFLATLPLKTESHGHMEVGPAMVCLPQNLDLKLAPMLYALGDSVCVYDPRTGKPMPGVAPAAMEQADVVAKNILNDIETAEGRGRKTKRAIYEPREHPYVLPVGGRWAAAKIGPIAFDGILGWLFKEVIEINYGRSLR